MENSQKENKYQRAQERVRKIKKFYSRLLSHTVIISFLAGLNYYTNQWDNPWFLWAAFGLGIGLAFRAVKAFDLNPLFGQNWEERKIKEFMREDERRARWE